MSDDDGVCLARWATGNARHAPGDLCRAPATHHVGDSDLCYHHYERAMDWYYKYRAELPERNRQLVEEGRRIAAEKSRLAAEARSIVYFLRRTDGMIKIGVTTNYKNRLSAHQAKHGPLRLLLAYAGTREEERYAHTRFARCRAEGEWFRPELRLLLEIQRIRNGVAKVGRKTALPDQVPIGEIKAIIKALRDQDREAAA